VTPKKKTSDTTSAFEHATAKSSLETYVLRLYVTGTTPASVRAVANIKSICEEHLNGRYELDVIDLYQQPVLAKGEQIIAAPTLIKKLPLPLRRIIGDMSDTQRVLVGMDLQKRG
jgi:circadian clock protein KaiB